jgi:hypothetical protein
VEDRNTAIIFFFGLFWATALASVNGFRAFDTYACCHGKERWKAVLRCIASFIIVNLLPAGGLWVLYRSPSIVPPTGAGAIAVVCAGIASLAVFATPRLLHAAIATRHTRDLFYNRDDWREVSESRRDQPNLLGHLIPAAAYLIIPWGRGCPAFR